MNLQSLPSQEGLYTMSDKLRELELLKQKLQMQRELPFLYKHQFYPWQREFYDSQNKMCFLTAANQIGKSTIMQKKCVNWCTDKALWKELWPHKMRDELDLPSPIWYLYPDSKLATAEFHEKWVRELLPSGKMKNHPVYGWEAKFEKRMIQEIRFNSGVTLYFKTYAQNPASLQAATVYAIFCFTEGHLVECEEGLKKIEDIRVGDRVLTRQGHYEEIQDTYTHEDEVIVRYLSNGERLEGTPGHNVWTKNRGYVPFEKLTSKDVLDTSPSWQRKKRKYLKERPTTVTPSLKIEDIGILQKLIGERDTIFTKLCGSAIEVLFRAAFWFTIKTRTLPIIRFLIWSLLVDLNTPEDIKKRNGEAGSSESTGKKYVSAALRFLKHVLPKKLRENTVLKNVGRHPIRRLGNVLTVVRFFLLGKTLKDTAVLPGAYRFGKKKTVYNINVKNVHNYYLAGINLKNCDEELPEHLYDELKFRLSNTDGYFNMAFTATLNQELWRCTMEESGKLEKFPKAFKKQVSLYDCQFYEDGSPSEWTKERIQAKIDDCSSDTEVQRRIFGKFVTEKGKKYPQFDPEGSTMEPRTIPKDWSIYEGMDYGSGGKKGHPSAIVFVALSPDRNKGEVFLGWRGDGVQTTAGDVINQHYQMIDQHELEGRIVETRYDYHCKDLFVIAQRAGEDLLPANKKMDDGVSILNTLFKYGSLKIHLTPELEKLCKELNNLLTDTDKRNAVDDFSDALRYCVATMPWDWSKIKIEKPLRKKKPKSEIDLRRERFIDPTREVQDEILDEIDEWNSLY